MSVLDHEDINNYIVEYLKAHGMSKTADSIQQEIKSIFQFTQASISLEKLKYIPKDWNNPG